ncbi:predicted protein [Streptomyces viridochromogenes DSM 40736]|uniref:Predicted protein n=1 Tax=Streptomyces viridochromogenes (strain DSM 40736 / JCM 4977 / BCRC 1201 / Tue 494) TaxID=591159 RepID=D9XBN5_STRVT|nr:predicted protein [Streptomyces viridochromogenes DSM 40736]
MDRTAVNPVTWSVEMGFHQGEIVSGHTTDVDLLLQHYGVPASRLGAAEAAPATTMLGGDTAGGPRPDGRAGGNRRRVMRPPAGRT